MSKIQKNILLFAILPLLLMSCTIKKRNLMPIYVEPYYNTNPFKIAVGEYSNKLATNDDDELMSVASEIKANINNVNLPTLYVLAIRLYDFGKKDEATYWFYTAQFRTYVFQKTIVNKDDASELLDALDSFWELSGTYINGHAYGNIDNTVKIIRQAIKDNQSMSGFDKIYPGARFDDSKLREAIATTTAGAEGLVKYTLDNREKIKAERIKNGIVNKY